jgi:hypothetical protein
MSPVRPSTSPVRRQYVPVRRQYVGPYVASTLDRMSPIRWTFEIAPREITFILREKGGLSTGPVSAPMARWPASLSSPPRECCLRPSSDAGSPRATPRPADAARSDPLLAQHCGRREQQLADASNAGAPMPRAPRARGASNSPRRVAASNSSRTRARRGPPIPRAPRSTAGATPRPGRAIARGPEQRYGPPM